MGHIPVLLQEVIKVLNPRPGEFFIDGTAGSHGHTREIENRVAPGGRVLAIDWEKTGENYADLPRILKSRNLPKADGLLLDLGFSSEQLEAPESGGKGFSFLRDEPLVMTYNSGEEPVHRILERLSESELRDVIRNFGEERFAGRIARTIKENLPIKTSGRLAEVIKGAVPKSYERGRIHPATRTFMALRIYANRELENLEKILGSLHEVLVSGGRVAIISFHSLEDRMVKSRFREMVKADRAKIITKKPITATDEGVAENPRARSAKLRGIVLC